MAEVAALAGLARPSAYQYYKSRHDLLNALVLDVFPRWARRVELAMAAQEHPADRILGYVLTNIELFAEGEHAIGKLLAAEAPGEVFDTQSARMHQQLLDPLVGALEAMGTPDPAGTAELINAIVHAGTRLLEAGTPLRAVQERVMELLGPYVREHGGTAKETTP